MNTKTWLVVIIAATIGTGIGAAMGFREAWVDPNATYPAIRRDKNPPDATGSARVVVEQTEHDFGSMDRHHVGRHEFVVKNAGDGPLVLSLGATTCQCTVSEVADRVVAPGESTTVTLTWTAQDFLGPYEQTAEIDTNDPRQPTVTLRLRGRITSVLSASPQKLIFSRIPWGEPSEGEVRFYCTAPERFEITGHEFSDPATAEWFDLAMHPLSEDQLQGEPEAKSGYRMVVVVKSGLPQGPFQQTIRLKTSLAAVPVVEVPVSGKVGADIAVLGRGWNERAGVLELGIVEQTQGATTRLTLLARGRHYDVVHFEVVQAEPSGVIEATLGEKTQISDGLTSQTPLIICIPPGTKPVNRLGAEPGGLGRIILTTNHPRMPQITIPVSFAIESGT